MFEYGSIYMTLKIELYAIYRLQSYMRSTVLTMLLLGYRVVDQPWGECERDGSVAVYPTA